MKQTDTEVMPNVTELRRSDAEWYQTVPINAKQCQVTPMLAPIEQEDTDQMLSNRREGVMKK